LVIASCAKTLPVASNTQLESRIALSLFMVSSLVENVE
jgi:hypothetical protein